MAASAFHIIKVKIPEREKEMSCCYKSVKEADTNMIQEIGKKRNVSNCANFRLAYYNFHDHY